MEETQICMTVKHSMKAVENYLQTFKRVVSLRVDKKFTDHEIAVVTGSSQRLVKQHLQTYEKFKNHGIAEHRLAEINIDGSEYYRETGKKRLTSAEFSKSEMERKVKQTIANRAAVYGPQTHKIFVGALNAFFTNQCPQLGGDLSCRVLVKAIEEMVRKFFPETSHLKAGQMPWITIHTKVIAVHVKLK